MPGTAGSRCRTEDGRAVLEVKDDGHGALAPEGSGLSGMRERLRQVAGTLERGAEPRHATADARCRSVEGRRDTA